MAQVAEDGHILTEGQPLKVMLDMDGVIYNWTRAVAVVAEAHFGLSPIPWEDCNRWGWLDNYITPAQWKWLWTEGVNLMFGQEESYYPGAPSFARWLGSHTFLEITTSRPQQASVPTARWIAGHRIQFRALNIVESGTPKSSIVPDADVYIDDKPEIIHDVIENTKGYALVPDRLWNRGQLPKSKRVHVYTELREARQWIEARMSTS